MKDFYKKDSRNDSHDGAWDLFIDPWPYQIDPRKQFSPENEILGFEHAIKLRNFSSKKGIELDENDVVKSVLQKAVNL